MVDYKAYPNEALEKLKELTEEVPGVSLEDLKEIMPEYENLEELYNFHNKQITNKLKESLDNFWDDFQVNKKLYKLKLLENSKLTEPLWYPLSSKTDKNDIKLKTLKTVKENLLKEIEETRKKSSEMCKQLNEKTKLINEQIAAIDNIDMNVILDNLTK